MDLDAPETAAYYTSSSSAVFSTTKSSRFQGTPLVNSTTVSQRVSFPQAGAVDAFFRCECCSSPRRREPSGLIHVCRSFFENFTTMSYGPVNYSVVFVIAAGHSFRRLGPHAIISSPNAVKLGISCSNWTFAVNTAAWRFWLNFTVFTPQPLNITRSETFDYARRATRFYVGTSALEILIYFNINSILDGRASNQRFTDYQINVVSTPEIGVAFRQAWQYTRFSSIIYDPDFSLLVKIDDPSASSTAPSIGQSSASPSDATAAALVQASVPVWIPIVVTISILVLVGAGAVGYLIWRRRRMQLATARLRSVVEGTASPTTAAQESSNSAAPTSQPPGKRWTMADRRQSELKNSAVLSN